MKTNFDIEMKKEISKISNESKKPKLLLHSCCAPCSGAVIEKLIPHFNLTIFYYNPNIFPETEYIKRKEEQIKFIKNFKHVNYIDSDYCHEDFLNAIKTKELLGEKSIRCYECYKLRLKMTAKKAKTNNFDYFTTTLSISPHKLVDWINEIGIQLENEYKIKFLKSDFKKNNGFKRSLEISKEFDFYRQNYCGCEFSKKEKDQ